MCVESRWNAVELCHNISTIVVGLHGIVWNCAGMYAQFRPNWVELPRFWLELCVESTQEGIPVRHVNRPRLQFPVVFKANAFEEILGGHEGKGGRLLEEPRPYLVGGVAQFAETWRRYL